MTEEILKHARSDVAYVTGLAEHIEQGGTVTEKNIGDLIAMVRWNAEMLISAFEPE